MAKQLTLIKGPRKNTKLWWIVNKTTYGGSLNYRKVPRPFDSKKLTHAVLKAQLGRAIWFTRYSATIQKVLNATATTYGVRIRDVAINHNHIHILFGAGSRETQGRFLRLFAAELGRKYSKLRRRLGLKSQKLWVRRPFTRLVSWGKKSVVRILVYFKRNRDEALGFIQYQPRKASGLDRFLARWACQQNAWRFG